MMHGGYTHTHTTHTYSTIHHTKRTHAHTPHTHSTHVSLSPKSLSHTHTHTHCHERKTPSIPVFPMASSAGRCRARDREPWRDLRSEAHHRSSPHLDVGARLSAYTPHLPTARLPVFPDGFRSGFMGCAVGQLLPRDTKNSREACEDELFKGTQSQKGEMLGDVLPWSLGKRKQEFLPCLLFPCVLLWGLPCETCLMTFWFRPSAPVHRGRGGGDDRDHGGHRQLSGAGVSRHRKPCPRHHVRLSHTHTHTHVYTHTHTHLNFRCVAVPQVVQGRPAGQAG